MQSILLTGGTGYIRRAVMAYFARCEMPVHGISRSGGVDLTQPDAPGALDGAVFSCVLHPGVAVGVPDSWERPARHYAANTLGTQHVLDFCARHSLPLVFISTYVYGIPHYLPINALRPVDAVNPYALSRFLAEELCRFYARHCNIHCIILRLFNIYGPGQPESFLVPHILEQALHAPQVRIRDLAPRRDHPLLDDALEAFRKMIAAPPSRRV